MDLTPTSRKKKMALRDLLFSLFVAVFLVAGGASFSYAGDLEVSGFADIITVLSDEVTDDLCSDADGKSANCVELKTGVTAEVDLEYSEGPVTFRLDLDIPSIGNEAAGVGPAAGDIGIEQAKFVWAIPGGDQFGLSLTGGAFNAPIGFEAQDAPDMLQTTNGQLFFLVPSNLAGFMVSGGTEPITVDLYFANEWRLNQAEENSLGALVTLTPIEMASLAVGYITSPEGAGDEDVIDVVATGTISPMDMVDLLLAGEFLTDENNTAFAVVANVTHNTPTYPHGLTVRFDSVDCDTASAYCGGEATPTTLTVAANVALADNLSTVLEWNTVDPDVSGVDEFDTILLEFVATFP
jgi:hypothetical protein